MPVRTQATPETVLDCATDIVALGKTRQECVKDFPAISGRSERYIREVAKATVPEFQEKLLGKLERLLEEMLDYLLETYRDIPAASRAVAIGIIYDKIALLQNRPTAVTASAHVHITAKNGKVREVARGEIASVLMGRAGRGHGNGRTVDHSGQAAGPAD